MSSTIVVDAASVTELRSGDRVLLLRTNVGPARLLVPESVARGIFRVTNPRHELVHKPEPAVRPAGSP